MYAQALEATATKKRKPFGNVIQHDCHGSYKHSMIRCYASSNSSIFFPLGVHMEKNIADGQNIQGIIHFGCQFKNENSPISANLPTELHTEISI